MTEDDLRALAREAIYAHTAQRRSRYPSGAYRIPVDRAWMEVAMRAVELKVSPTSYVTALWRAFRDPQVNMMKSKRSALSVSGELAQRETHVRLAVQLQSKRLLQWRREGQRSTEEMLTDSRGQFEPAFIYCVAKWEGLTDLAGRYEQEARVALADPVTGTVFAQAFPEVLGEGL